MADVVMTYKGVTKPVPADMVAQMQAAGAVVAPPVAMTYKGVTKEVPADQVATMTAAGAVVEGPGKAAGRARAFGEALTQGLGEKAAAVGARYGAAFGQGEGVIDTARRVGSEVASDYASAIKGIAADPFKAIPMMPSPATVGRAVGLVAPEQGTPEEQQAIAEHRAQLAADEAADPLGANVAAGAGHVLGVFAGPGPGREMAGVISKAPAALKGALSGPVAKTVGQVASGTVERVLGPLAKVPTLYRASVLADDAATMLLRKVAVENGTTSAAALATASGLPLAQVERALAKLGKSSSFKSDVANAAERIRLGRGY